MTRVRRFVLSLAVVLAGAAPSIAQTGITGDWDMTIQSPQGVNTVKVSFTQDGEKVSGLFKSQMGELPFTGTLLGKDLKFGFTIPVQGQPLEITMTGKVEGESIEGKAQFGGFAEGDWSAKRATAATSATAASTSAPVPAAATSPAAATALATGQWEVTIKTPAGEFPASASVTEDNGKLTGTITNQMGEVPFSGTIEGKTVKFAFTAQTPQGSLPVTMTGDIDGDTIVNGKAEVTGMGTLEWTAKRKQ